MIKNDIHDHNVLFITLDSCTYQSAVMAKTPNLSKIGPLMEAETSGTFTFPAHHSFFIGHLPKLITNKFYFGEISDIWRSNSARKTNNVAVNFTSRNIVEHYYDNGYDVRGYGGVNFFNTYKNNTLPELFPKFKYFGLKKNPILGKRTPRPNFVFPLNNIQEIVRDLKRDNPFFIFINCPETHIPYDCPTSKLPKNYSKLISRLYKEHYDKRTYSLNSLPFSQDEISILKRQQVISLEWIDKQIGKLVPPLLQNKLPLLVVVCADHGEEFGEGGRYGHAHCHETIMKVPIWSSIITNNSS